MPSPTPLFLVGVGRSGTTALTEVFAEHPRIVLGMERFKYMWGSKARVGELTRDRLEWDRFFDFSDGLTNISPEAHPRWADHYARQGAKWEDAIYVGDKMTRARMQAVWQQLPDARFVCIVRDAHHVTASWDARANQAADVNWPQRLNSEVAVDLWNSGNTRIRRARRQRPEQVIIVEYAAFFGDPESASLRRVLDWLGLDHAPEIMAAFASAHETYVGQIADKPRALTPQARAFVDEHVAADLWNSS